jgi:hypothetical protein
MMTDLNIKRLPSFETAVDIYISVFALYRPVAVAYQPGGNTGKETTLIKGSKD